MNVGSRVFASPFAPASSRRAPEDPSPGPRSFVPRNSLARTLSARIGTPALLALLFARVLAAQQTSTISGVVVDSASNRPIAGVEVRVEPGGFAAVSQADGAFRLDGVPVGELRLIFRHLAYGEHAETLLVDNASSRFLVRLSQRALELSPLEVEVSPDRARFLGGGNPGNAIDAEEIAAAEARGLSLIETLQREVPGIRVRTVPGGWSCLEYRLLAGAFPIGGTPDSLSAALLGVDRTMNTTCREMAVYLDGVRVQESATLLLQMPLGELERVEVLSPGEAGVRYGSAAAGVLLLYSKQGALGDAPLGPARKVTGFGWYETEPYRWPRVIATSLLSNAAAVGLSHLALGSCLEDREDTPGAASGCSPGPFAFAAGMFTGTVVTFSTRWAGGTALSSGRAFPAMVLGSLSSFGGYFLLIKGQAEASAGMRAAGLGVLTLGMPLVVALSDRVLRVLR